MIVKKLMKRQPKTKTKWNPKTKTKVNKVYHEELPVDCVAKIFSMMSPLSPEEVCKFGSVSKVFRFVADEDSVWEKFLPHDYEELIFQSRDVPFDVLSEMPKKSLYLHLCDNRTTIDYALSFHLDRETGKKTLLLGRERFSKKPDVYPSKEEKEAIPVSSRFHEAAELGILTHYRFKASIDPRLLSEQTTYKAFLIFRLGYSSFNLVTAASKIQISFKADHEHSRSINPISAPKISYLRPRLNMPNVVKRRDGLKEIEINTFFNHSGINLSPLTSLLDEYIWTEQKDYGIILIGVELRPVD